MNALLRWPTAATKTSLADEAETAPDLEPDPVLHLRGLPLPCLQRQGPTANRASGLPHLRARKSPRVACLLTLTI